MNIKLMQVTEADLRNVNQIKIMVKEHQVGTYERESGQSDNAMHSGMMAHCRKIAYHLDLLIGSMTITD